MAIAQIDPESAKVINKFNSALEAEKETGINNANISHCLVGRRPTAGGYSWRYITGTSKTKGVKKRGKVNLFCQCCSDRIAGRDKFIVCLKCLDSAKKETEEL